MLAGSAGYNSGQWEVPLDMQVWRMSHFGQNRTGRKVPLIVVGGNQAVLRAWIRQAGERPIVMAAQFNTRKHRADATHVVLEDVDLVSQKEVGWRDLFLDGYIDVRPQYSYGKCLKWSFPLAIMCRVELDPRRDKRVADFLQRSHCIIVDAE